MMKLKKRIEASYAIANFVSWLLSGYLRFCIATTRWTIEGDDSLSDALKDGPVILAGWHRHLMLAAHMWPHEQAALYTLRDPSPAGNLAAATQARSGAKAVTMRANQSNFSVSRQILKVIRKGDSLGLTGDGPRGPARVVKQAPIEWARASGCPIFMFAWSGKRVVQLGSWDRLMIPAPFTRGICIFRRWDVAVPRKLETEDYDRLRQSLGEGINEIEKFADQFCGVTPRP